MDEKFYKITLTNGAVVSNLKVNGNNFISPIFLDSKIFEYNTSKVIIESDDGEVEVLNDVEYYQTQIPGIQHCFALVPIPKDKLLARNMQSQIDYIKMMTDIE